jgi:hypothetical protein
LKKLPGVDVDDDGNITVNGRAVNRILVDGKDFFGGDSKIATRNLPANLIDKVQVTDDKEQIDRNPDISKADIGQVINLKLKRSIKKGWFGKAYAGGTANGRYETGAIINSFRDTLQVSMMAYTNNLNRAGFGVNDLDKLGGFNRSGLNSVMIMSDGGIALNDVSFGGTGQGIQRSTGAGININHNPTKKLGINLQYFFGGINSDARQLTSTEQFFNDTTLTTKSQSVSNSSNYTHRLGGRIAWQIDTLSSLNFRPSIQLSKTTGIRDFVSSSFSNYEPLLNESSNDQHSTGNAVSYSHDFSYNKRFKKKGRFMFVNNYVSIGHNNTDQYNDVNNTFYNGQTTHSTLNQLRKRDATNLSANLNMNYTESLSKKWNLRLANSFSWFRNKDEVNSFDRDPSTLKYEVPNVGLSNGLNRNGFRNNSSVGVRWNNKKFSVNPAINFQWLHINNRFLKNPSILQNYFYAFPALNLAWDRFNFNYSIYLREPYAGDLQPVIDNTNPLYQSLGNPDLVPTISHSIYSSIFKYDPKKQFSYNFNTNFALDKNAIVRERNVDDKGVQITKPVNVDNTWRVNANVSISKQYKLQNKWQFALRPSANMNYSKNFIIVNNNKGDSKLFTFGSGIGWAFNWKDLFEFNQRYSISFSKSSYQNPAFTDLKTTSHYATSEIVIRMPANWVWESTVDYRYNPKVAPGISKNVTRLNAAVNYLFLKDKKGQLKLSVYDLLKQNANTFRSVRENYIQDVETNVLTRYFLLTFTYNIRDFKAGKVGGRQSFFFF